VATILDRLREAQDFLTRGDDPQFRLGAVAAIIKVLVFDLRPLQIGHIDLKLCEPTRAFLEGDVIAQTAAKIFEVPVKDVTPEMRDKARMLTFGMRYSGDAAGTLAKTRSPKDTGQLATSIPTIDAPVEKPRQGRKAKTVKSGDPVFPCPYCPAKYVVKTSLYGHVHRKHQGERKRAKKAGARRIYRRRKSR
jgi:hypothetical protein